MNDNYALKQEVDSKSILQSLQDDLKKSVAVFLDTLMQYPIDTQNMAVGAIIQELVSDRNRKIDNASNLIESNGRGIEMLFEDIKMLK